MLFKFILVLGFNGWKIIFFFEEFFFNYVFKLFCFDDVKKFFFIDINFNGCILVIEDFNIGFIFWELGVIN